MIEIEHNKGITTLAFTGNLDNSDFETFKIFFKEILKSNTLLLMDMRNASSASPNILLELASFIKESEDIIKKNLIASVILISSQAKWIKTVIDMLFSIRKPIKPNYVTTSHTDAIEFLMDNQELFLLTKMKN